MRLQLGGKVQCTDGPFGDLADVVVDPIARRVTHLVVQPHKHHERARLVPVERASAAGDGIALDCSVADVEALDLVHESAYLRVGEFPAAAPRHPVAEYVVAALVTAVAFIGSLLAHELAHSLVARRNGLQVEEGQHQRE